MSIFDKALAIVASLLFVGTVTFALIAWYMHDENEKLEQDIQNKTAIIKKRDVEINATKVASEAKGKIEEIRNEKLDVPSDRIGVFVTDF